MKKTISSTCRMCQWKEARIKYYQMSLSVTKIAQYFRVICDRCGFEDTDLMINIKDLPEYEKKYLAKD